MFEKLIDVLMLLIDAMNANTDAIRGRHPAQGTHQESAVPASDPPVKDGDVPNLASSTPPPPRKGSGKKPTPPPPGKGGTAASSTPAVTYTAEQVNEELMKLYEANNRDRAPIDEVFASFGVRGLNGLDPSKYGELMEAVKEKLEALQS